MLKRILKSALATMLAMTLAAPAFAQPAQQQLSEKPDVQKLVAVLKSDAPRKDKADACRILAVWGGKDAVDALAALLPNEEMNHMARYGLETIPDPAVDDAFRAALPKLKGLPLVGVIGSIGIRKDVKAIDALGKLLTNDDALVAQAAARALGKIGTVEAAKAIQTALPGAPAANHVAFCEGIFRAAETLLESGKRDAAISIYDSLREFKAAPHQVRAGAIRGAILARGQDGLKLLGETIAGKDYLLFAAACRAALEIAGPQVTEVLVANLGQLPADNQVMVLQILGKRADASGLPTLVAFAKKGATAVRVAAIRAMPEIGNASALPVLVELLKDQEREVAAAAQAAIGNFTGKEADAVVMSMLAGDQTEQRLLAMDLVGQRRIAGSVPLLMKAAAESDAKIRSTAIRRVGELGGATELPALLDMLMKSDQDAQTIEQAITAICARSDKPEEQAKNLASRLGNANASQKGSLLRILSGIGGDDALKAVRAAISDANADPQVRTTAIRALGSWKTTDVAPDLLTLAKNAKNNNERMLCLRAYLSLAGRQEVAPAQRLAMCRDAAGMVDRPEEKKLLLSALANVNSPDAMALITPYLDDASTREEAAVACISLAEKLLQGRQVAQNAPKVIPALQKVSTTTQNSDLATRAKELLQRAQRGGRRN